MADAGFTADDARRHELLARLQLLHARTDAAFDRLTRVAAAALGVPIALLTFVGPDRQWIPSRVGWDADTTTLLEAFCVCALGSPDLLEVPDATTDPRFSANPLVTGPRHIRFYAGQPLVFDGVVLGTLCVLDVAPRALSMQDRAVLADLAAIASGLIDQRHQQLQRAEQEAHAARLRQALQSSEAMLADAQRVARMGSWALQPATGEALFSAEIFHLLGRTPGPLGFDEFMACFGSGGQPPVLDLAQPCLREFPVTRADGSPGLMRWVSKPVEGLDGENGGQGDEAARRIVGTLQDITEPRQALQRLRAVEERFRLLWQTTPDVVVMLGEDNLIQFVNPAVRDVFGQAPEALLGGDLAVLQPERLRAMHRHGFRRYLESGVRRLDWRATEAFGLHADGHEFPIEISFSDMDCDGRRLFAACIRDISARKASEATQRELAEQLRRAQKMEAIGALAGGVAHDFNNVLAGILGNAALALQDLDAQHPAAPFLQQVQRGGRRGRSLVQQILSFARRQPQALAPCDLNALVLESTALLRPTLPPDARLELVLAEPGCRILADATQMQQIVMNLCANAWQALAGAPGTVTVSTEALALAADALQRLGLGRPDSGAAPGRFAHLWVHDSGQGMDEATAARVFEPFFTTKPAGEGTGLGLAVVHGIVGAHGGAIEVHSQAGQGSTFHVYLPLCVDCPPAKSSLGATAPDSTFDTSLDSTLDDGFSAAPPAPIGAPTGHGQRVLYVDDDPVMLLMVESLLQRLGYQPTVCAGAAAALAAVRAEPQGYAAVVTDFDMPELSGLQLAEQLRALHPGLPVLISSGNLTEAMRAQAAALGVQGLIHKQHTVEQLGGVLQRLLG